MSAQFLKDYQESKKWKGTLVLSEMQKFCDFLDNCIEEMKKSRNFPGMEGGEYDSALSDVQAHLRDHA